MRLARIEPDLLVSVSSSTRENLLPQPKIHLDGCCYWMSDAINLDRLELPGLQGLHCLGI
jgi:hypothetical protein